MGLWTIYKITSPSNRIYIGQSKNPKSRKASYKSKLGIGQTKLYNSILKHGWDVHNWEIIEEGIETIDIANEREIYWITFYDCVNNGLNCKMGGDGRGISDETKERMSHAIKKRWDSGEMQGSRGRKISEEHKQKILNANLGSKRSPETIEKLKKAKKNRTPEQEEKWLHSMKARKGYKHSEQTKKKISDTQKDKIIISRKIYCLNNNTIYESVRETAKELNLPNRFSINLVCSGKRNSLYGYKFSYYNAT